MRNIIPLALLVLLSGCTHEPDYSPTGATGPGSAFVGLIAPTNNQVLTGFSAFVVTVSASQGITSVDFEIDGEYKHTDRQPPYTYSWPSYEYSGGAHKVEVIGKVTGQTVDSDLVTAKLERRHIYVDDNGEPDGVGKRDDPVPTLSRAAFLSMSGDTIHVAAGHFADNYQTETRYGEKTVCAKLAGGVALVGAGAENTIIDCSGADLGIFYSGGSAGGLVEDVSVLNAGEACIYVSDADPKIRNCVIGNSNGDGLKVRDCDRKFTRVIRCDISSNAGNGIHMRNADLEVYYSSIKDNGSAGVSCERWGFPKMRMDTITENEVGIFVDIASSPNVTRCDIFNNNVYDLELGHGQLLDTLLFREIWWGSIDSTAIEERIYHVADDPTLPLVDYRKWLSHSVLPRPQ